jgi:hypothetical protein
MVASAIWPNTEGYARITSARYETQSSRHQFVTGQPHFEARINSLAAQNPALPRASFAFSLQGASRKLEMRWLYYCFIRHWR